ncbi:hypothetical protein [Hymenobacter radiodurans]|uniref:hypothetical protein n=1 Tax=Hymenobacter radiodurans TaxID=2496028 RepID=UPI001058A09F|nr:hypothetical protein [Hymenobacter radiodurans]
MNAVSISSINRLRAIRVLSFAVPNLFFLSLTVFFILNKKAYAELGLITPFQFNIIGMDFQFIPAIFSYFLVGILMMLLWILIAVELKKMKIAAYIFGLSGLVLVLFSLLPLSNKTDINQISTLLFCLSIAFVLINFAGVSVLLSNVEDARSKCVLLLVLAFMSYHIVDKFFILRNDFNLNYLIAASFLWYFYLYEIIKLKLLNKIAINFQN